MHKGEVPMLSSIINDYIDYMVNEKQLSQNSVNAYVRDVHLFKDYLMGNNISSLNEINKTNVITYLVHLQKNGKSASTLSRSLASIRCLFQYLHNVNLINEDPTLNLKTLRKEKKTPLVLTIEEIETILSMPDTNNLKGARDKAILELVYATGIKVSEISSINIENIDLVLGTLILGDGESSRIIPIGKKALSTIDFYLTTYRTGSDVNEPLFLNYNGCRITRQGIWKIIKSYSNKAAINKMITPQIIRNTFAMHLLQNGADIKTVQELLGNNDISPNIYSDGNDYSKIRAIYNKTHPRA